jgi:hypothetical protein
LKECNHNFQRLDQQSSNFEGKDDQKKISDNLQGIRIFKAFRNIKVRTEGASSSTKGNLSPDTDVRVEKTFE